ncbi:MAG: site-2 protease family protein [Sandaracinus sp.]|nr:site-2 protease family protein [Myxococcales bacterium]MCB9612477.1 site-2 protease family protein [Sandaracinus sp.]
MSDVEAAGQDPSPARRSVWQEWRVPLALFVATMGTTLYGGALLEGVDVQTPRDALAGWVFALPLLAILLTHELGHYVAGKLHGVDLSPPHFIPMPTALGTMGAVINMRERITRRDALLDVGAAGPLAGLVVAIPILIYGLATSEVREMAARSIEQPVMLEGHSVLYALLLRLTHGEIPEGHDIYLNSTALAGWAGLLLTLINLVPFGQLDGGHIAFALFGERQNRRSRWVLAGLPVIGVVVGLAHGVPTLLAKAPWDFVLRDFAAGANWMLWGVVLFGLSRLGGGIDHPPTDDVELSPKRRAVAWLCLVLFGLLFMPSWMRTY